jgi:putative membrane protein
MHWDGGWSLSWWMPVAMLVYWSLAAVLIVLISKAFGPTRPPDAAQVLDDRYARGEIDDEEYRRRRATLHEYRG